MGRLWNIYMRWFLKKTWATGLEQELNQSHITGEIVIPEIAEAARKMAAEGIVMLKNENNTLPIRPLDTVAVFGRCAVDYFSVGYGSGGDVIAPYKKNLVDGLRENGVQLFEPLLREYDAWRRKPLNVPDEGYWGHWPMNYPEKVLTDRTVAEAASCSMAIVVLGRAAGEDRENLLKKGSYFLTNAEKRLLKQVVNHFSRVAVIMNCGNIIDMSWTKEFGDRIGAILYAWQGGMESGTALADVLTGRVSPCGALTDTIAENYSDYPSSKSFGGKKYNNYVEDIYVGYRYFETFASDKVLFPFGYGLSYTSFSLDTKTENKDNTVSLNIQVHNTGSFEGRKIVQCYLCPPCGKLGNPSKVLVAFQKTDVLKPGQTQTISLNVDLNMFASYDDTGATGHRFCYVLEPGTYRLEVGSNVRDTICVFFLEKENLEVVNRLSEAAAIKPGCEFDRMVNKNGSLQYEKVPKATKNLKKQILDELPAALGQSETCVPFSSVMEDDDLLDPFVAQLSFEELDQITHGQGKMNSCYGIDGNAGAFGGVTESLRSRGIPAVITTDGPSGIRIRRTVSLLPCGTALACSFDPEGIKKLYSLISEEMKHWGSHMLLAPGMNIHRNPLCGRNFEYFSEDPYLSGKIAAAVIQGIQSNGRSACPKHFACNNQESYRNTNDSRVSERALREIYLKGFEIAIKEGKPQAIMSSYNKVNGVWSHYHYELITQILRQEWGYTGIVITDWWMQEGASEEFPQLRNDAYRLRAQVDVLMPGEVSKKNDAAARTLVASLKDPDGITLGEAQRCAKNVIRFIKHMEEQNAGINTRPKAEHYRNSDRNP